MRRVTLTGFIVLDHYHRALRAGEEISTLIAAGDLAALETVVEGFEQLPAAINVLLGAPTAANSSRRRDAGPRPCGTDSIGFNVGSMTERAPIHVGSGEPMLLLHPFMMSQNVWKHVAPLIADTGRYEVYAPTMLSHNGGRKGPFFLDNASLADDVERRLDDLGWDTAHVVGNSLGGWVAFELERRGRARTLTGIAPGGGWRYYSPAKFEIVGKFLAGMPLWFVVLLLRERVLKLPITRYLAYLPISGTPDVLSEENLADIIDDVMHCPAYYQLLVKALTQPGLLEIAEGKSPTHLVICEKDRVLPYPRFTRAFTTDLPEGTKVTHLDGVGHIPMFEAPQRVADLIVEFVDQHVVPPPQQAIS